MLSSEVLAKEKKTSVDLVDPVSFELIRDTLKELQLKLMAKGFSSNQIQDYFFKPYKADSEVSIKRIQDILDSIGIDEDQSLFVARFLIEQPDSMTKKF